MRRSDDQECQRLVSADKVMASENGGDGRHRHRCRDEARHGPVGYATLACGEDIDVSAILPKNDLNPGDM